MEDKNNNLGNFFRKRLSSPEEENMDWFNPDPRTDQVVLEQLLNSPTKRRSKLLYAALLALLFLSMLGYIGYLQYHLNAFKSTPNSSTHPTVKTIPSNNIAQPDAQPLPSTPSSTPSSQTNTVTLNRATYEDLLNNVQTLQEENKSLSKRLAQSNKTTKKLKQQLASNCAQNPIFPLAQAPSNYDKEAKITSDALNAFKAKVDDLSTGNALLDKQFSSATTATSNDETKTTESRQFLAVNPLATLEADLMLNPKANIPDITEPFTVKKKKRRKNSFEFGFELMAHSLLSENSRQIEGQRIAFQNIAKDIRITPLSGVSVAYSPVNNLWLRTGFRVGLMYNNIQNSLGVVYDDSKQYQLPSGDQANDFTLNSNTSYANSTNQLQLTIPNNILNGDLMEFNYSEHLEWVHLQLPISVEYYFGSRKWQPFIHLGAEWNVLHYQHNVSSINIQARNQTVDYNNTSNTTTQAAQLQFLSLVTGAGLNWNINKKFSLRSQFFYGYNLGFINASEHFQQNAQNSISFKLGLQYRF